MANQYHDAEGRFCSADHMEAEVERLGNEGKHAAAYTLNASLQEIREKREREQFVSTYQTQDSTHNLNHTLGGTTSWEKTEESLRGNIIPHLNGALYQRREATPMAPLIEMFVVNADEHKKLTQKREAAGADVREDKAVYRAMMSRTLHLYESLTAYGEEERLPSDDELALKIRALKEEEERKGTAQGRVNAIAYEKLNGILLNSYDDEDWTTYEDRARAILKPS